MNIFPNRKCQTNFNKKITNKKSNIILKTKVEKFPLLHKYIKI